MSERSLQRRHIIATVACLFGEIFFCVTAFSCASFSAHSTASGQGGFKFGYWAIQAGEEGQCTDYDQTTNVAVDAPLKVGRACGILGAMLGFLLLAFAVTTVTCVRYPRAWYHLPAGCMFSMIAFVLMLLVGGRTGFCTSNTMTTTTTLQCDFTAVGYLSLVSAAFWFVAGCFCISSGSDETYDDELESPSIVFNPFRPRPERTTTHSSSGTSRSHRTSRHEDTVSSSPPTHLPEGSASSTVVETVNHQDGSQTETTTRTTRQRGGSLMVERRIVISERHTMEPPYSAAADRAGRVEDSAAIAEDHNVTEESVLLEEHDDDLGVPDLTPRPDAVPPLPEFAEEEKDGEIR